MRFLDNLYSHTFQVKNGVSKQKMHMILEASQSMLKMVKLSKDFWVKAITMVCFLQN
jgi:hypothetical protein